MGLHGLLCGCFAIPKASGEVQAQKPQDLPVEVVLAVKNSKQGLLPVEEGGAPCDGCLANDSVNSISNDRTSKSRMNPGGDYRYGLSNVRAPLSSRALVGGVEYDSFFVNPLAEGSHEGGVAIDYAGATLGVGMGHNNPLAAEYSIGSSSTSSPTSSVPGSPAQVKIRAMAPGAYLHNGIAGGGDDTCCGDGACPTAPGTPLQGGMSVKVLCVDIASGLSCSEHSCGLPILPTDAAPCCLDPDEEVHRPRRRASPVSGSGLEAVWYGETGATNAAMAPGQEQLAGREALVRRLQSEDACSTAVASRSDSSHSLLSDTAPPSPSPWRPGGRSSGGGDFDCSAQMPVRSCCGGGSGGGGSDDIPSDPMQLPTAPSLSAPSDLLPKTPLFDAEPINRRLGSETGALPGQREEVDAAGRSADSDAFAPCTPPLAVRDAGSAAGAGSQGGREPSRPQGMVRSDGGECGEKVPELRSISSAPSPPRLDATLVEGRCLAEALMQVRSVPMELSEVVAQPQAMEVSEGMAQPQSVLLESPEEAMPRTEISVPPPAVMQPWDEEVQSSSVVAQPLPAGTTDREAQPDEEAAKKWEAAEEEAQLESGAADEPPASVDAPSGLSYAAAVVVVDEPQLPGCPPAQWEGQELRPSAAAVGGGDALGSQSVPDCWSLDISADAAAADAAPATFAPAASLPPSTATGLAETGEPPSSGFGDEASWALVPLELRKGLHSGGGAGGRNSTRSSGEVPAAAPPPSTMSPITPEAPEPRRALAVDSISGLAMTRLLIRQLGLIPMKQLKGEESPLAATMPLPAARDGTAAGDLPLPPLSSPFAAAVAAAEAALHLMPAVVAAPAGQGAAADVIPVEQGRSRESVSVTFALELPYGHTAAVAAAESPAADAVELPYLAEADAAAGGGCAADDLSSSLASTRESSAVFDERSSYGVYGAVSSRSMQGWLEPQGWKPLRERYGGGVGQ